MQSRQCSPALASPVIALLWATLLASSPVLMAAEKEPSAVGNEPSAVGNEPSAATKETFPQCVSRLQSEAQARGLPDRLIVALGDVKPLERTISYDRNQPEFVQTFSGYYGQRVTDYRIEKGRAMLAEHREFLADLTRRYGIPGQYLVSFWALESNFGRHIGKMPILDTLTTLACDQRRSTFFTGELFAALELMNHYQFEVAQMEGSWAGAIGQTQFLPSVYVRYGIDGDGDQQVDLWHSEKDALASAAHFLQQLGWESGLRWGREFARRFSLPPGRHTPNPCRSGNAWA